jgi:hypothetical protein
MIPKLIQKESITLLLTMFMVDVEVALAHIIVLKIVEAQKHKE